MALSVGKEGARLAGRQDGLHDGFEDEIMGPSSQSVCELRAESNDDEVQHGSHKEDLIPGAVTPVGVFRKREEGPAGVRPPSQAWAGPGFVPGTGGGGSPGVLGDRIDPGRVNQLLALPVASMEHQPSHPRDGPGCVGAPSPIGHCASACCVAPFRGLVLLLLPYPGFRCAPPWATFCRPLSGAEQT